MRTPLTVLHEKPSISMHIAIKIVAMELPLKKLGTAFTILPGVLFSADALKYFFHDLLLNYYCRFLNKQPVILYLYERTRTNQRISYQPA